MKRYKYKVLLLVSVVMIMAACKKYEPYPIEKVTIDYVFDKGDSDAVNAYRFLMGVYANMVTGHNNVGGDGLDAASDDAVSSSLTPTTTQVTILARGAYNSLNLPADENVWKNYYNGIRSATIFVNNIDVVPTKKKSEINGIPLSKIYKNEARFLRALFYFQLVRRWGGVPLLGNKVYQLEDKMEVPRNSFEECINFIVGECTAIQDSMRTAPLTDEDAHSVTRGSALALKARALLLAASPLFNGGNIEPSNNLTGYTDSKPERWKLAADAAKELIDDGNYALLPDARDVFLIPNNRELILIVTGHTDPSVEKFNGPPGFPAPNLGQGRTSPTQELVDAFPMKNGKAITDPSSGYSFTDPYGIGLDTTRKRDPRLAQTIFYNGARWQKSFVETYEGGASKNNLGQQQTLTGYYQRKFMGKWDEAPVGQHNVDWTIFRYAATLLDYAEAQNEVNGPGSPTAEVSPFRVIINLRKRAGILPGSDNLYGIPQNIDQAGMRELIRTERRVELAFEQNRYFDIRRWKIADEVMNQPRKGMTIVKSGSDLTYSVNNVLTTKFIAPKMYLYPIPYDEVVKNKNMKQNPGW